MRIVYFDESGDDGYPRYSSPIFALSALYMHYLAWQGNFEQIKAFRSELKRDFGIPVKTEFHTKHFILNKRPYRSIGLADAARIEVMDRTADLMGRLDLQIVNVVIDKTALRFGAFAVLDRTLTYSLQRIENDLDPARNPDERFLTITDEGRVGAMRTTARRIRRFNMIPSRYGGAQNRPIQGLIEDPLPKNSKESYFIQLADYVALVTYLYVLGQRRAGAMHGRMPAAVDARKISDWMNRMTPSLNTRASSSDRYGVVIHPAQQNAGGHP